MKKTRVLSLLALVCILTMLLTITVSADGVKNSWVTNADGTYSYYDADGNMVRDAVMLINGSYYGFDDAGIMYDGVEFYCNGDYYRARSGGRLITGWYQHLGAWYYYGADCAAAQGLTEVDGVQYYFYWGGEMMVNKYVQGYFDGENACYMADGQGHLTKLSLGWNLYKGEYYYLDEGEGLITYEFREIGGKLYYFNEYGVMFAGGPATLSGYSGGSYIRGNYRAKANGALYRNEWYKTSGGWTYYGEDGERVENGLRELGGAYYYFEDGVAASNTTRPIGDSVYVFDANAVGKKVTGSKWVQDEKGRWLFVIDGVLFEEGLLPSGSNKYVFESGYLVENGAVEFYDETSGEWRYYLSDSRGCLITKPGWYTIYGEYWFTYGDGIAAEGWLKSGSSWYYLNPAMVSSTVFTDYETGKVYVAGKSGAAVAVTSSGLYNTGNELVYIEDGKIVAGQWKWISGAWYYFDEGGSAVQNLPYTVDGILYLFDGSGRMLSNGWKYVGGDRYYADASGKLATGLQTIDGKQWVFDNYGVLQSSRIYVYNGVSYIVGVDGSVVGKATTSNGWNLVGGAWYYAQNGTLLKDRRITVSGSSYYLDGNGRMVTNQIQGSCFYGADGRAKTGWIKWGGKWYYANPSTGSLYGYGIYEINGKEYLFVDYVMQTGLHQQDGRLINCDANGVIVSNIAMPEGMTYVDGEVIYCKNGRPYTGWLGNNYFEDGYMACDRVINTGGVYYYLKPNGECVTGGFYQLPYSNWIYADASGALAYDEWRYIGGYWYFFNYSTMVSDGFLWIDGICCMFDENGHYIGEAIDFVATNRSDGWYYQNGNYYYSYAGYRVMDKTMLIDGNWYAFDYDGAMVANGLRWTWEGGLYYYTASGARANYTGWVRIDGDWYFFNADHSVRLGWIQSGNNLYYIGVNYDETRDTLTCEMLTGYHVIDSRLYVFDANGVCKGDCGVNNGWFKAGSDWYYLEYGQLANGYRVIGGAEYYFEDGLMLTNCIRSDGSMARYIGKDGVMVNSERWIATDAGWIYVSQSGEVAMSGIWEIRGIKYVFADGILVN